VQGSLDEKDLAELTAVCLDAHGLGDKLTAQPVPLSDDHLPTGPDDVDAVSVCTITDVQDVNALAAGQTLQFLPENLTVLYGGNASGKSGYVRVLKACCRARARDAEVLAYVFAPSSANEPSATIHYRVGESDRTAQWKSGVSAPEELAAVSVFDRDCASVYVDEENELAFRPMGLDAFDKLANACLHIREHVQGLLGQVHNRRPASLADSPVQVSSQVGQMLASLTGSTPPEHVRALDRLSEEQRERLTHLGTALGTDPAREAARLEADLRRMKRLAENVEAIETAVSDAALKELRTLQTEAVSKREAADLVATGAFEDDPLPEIGSETWKALWETARRYSEGCVYPGLEFPVVGERARCVLCQQALNEDAKDRLVRFEQFVRAEAEKVALEAEDALRHKRATIEQGAAIGQDTDELVAELRTLNETLAAKTATFLQLTTLRASALTKALEGHGWDGIPSLPASPSPGLQSLLILLKQNASELQAAVCPKGRAAMQTEYHQLADRLWLSKNLDDVLSEIDRLKQEAGLRQAIADTDTTAITKKSTELTKAVVTEELCQAFQEEISKLSAPPIRVHIETAGARRGVLYHRIRLTDAADVPVGRVVSEGEHQCIALATFLAELATSPDTSGIVLDDPVCSLDHVRRRRVAERLAEEARKRQVVVFTHDIVFLSYLRKAAEEGDVEHRILSVETVLGSGPGVCDVNVPWEGASVKKRIGSLKNTFQRAKAQYLQGKTDDYAVTVRSFNNQLRQTWERVVEQLLLNGVIQRFEPDVHTKQLDKVVDISQTDCDRVNAGMSECSRLLHDQPPAANEPIPGPGELHQALLNLEKWIVELNPRR